MPLPDSCVIGRGYSLTTTGRGGQIERYLANLFVNIPNSQWSAAVNLNVLAAILAVALNVVSHTPPDELKGRTVVYTLESVLLKTVKHRVEPVYDGPAGEGSKKQVGVVEIYVDAGAGRVIRADVTQAPSRAHAAALKKAVMQWRFIKALETDVVLAAPITFYFVTGKGGRVSVERAI